MLRKGSTKLNVEQKSFWWLVEWIQSDLCLCADYTLCFWAKPPKMQHIWNFLLNLVFWECPFHHCEYEENFWTQSPQVIQPQAPNTRLTQQGSILNPDSIFRVMMEKQWLGKHSDFFSELLLLGIILAGAVWSVRIARSIGHHPLTQLTATSSAARPHKTWWEWLGWRKISAPLEQTPHRHSKQCRTALQALSDFQARILNNSLIWRHLLLWDASPRAHSTGILSEPTKNKKMPIGRSYFVFFYSSLFTSKFKVVNYSDTTNSRLDQPSAFQLQQIPRDCLQTDHWVIDTTLNLSVSLIIMIVF